MNSLICPLTACAVLSGIDESILFDESSELELTQMTERAPQRESSESPSSKILIQEPFKHEQSKSRELTPRNDEPHPDTSEVDDLVVPRVDEMNAAQLLFFLSSPLPCGRAPPWIVPSGLSMYVVLAHVCQSSVVQRDSNQYVYLRRSISRYVLA